MQDMILLTRELVKLSIGGLYPINEHSQVGTKLEFVWIICASIKPVIEKTLMFLTSAKNDTNVTHFR